jgi:hypothetical protein
VERRQADPHAAHGDRGSPLSDPERCPSPRRVHLSAALFGGTGDRALN